MLGPSTAFDVLSDTMTTFSRYTYSTCSTGQALSLPQSQSAMKCECTLATFHRHILFFGCPSMADVAFNMTIETWYEGSSNIFRKATCDIGAKPMTNAEARNNDPSANQI